MALSLAQSVTYGSGFATPGVSTKAYGSNVTKGHLLVFVALASEFTAGNNQNFSNVHDSQGITWSGPIAPGAGENVAIFWAIAAATGANTVSFTTSANAPAEIYLYEVTGFAGVPTMVASTSPTGAGTAPSAGPLTVPTGAFLIAGFVFDSGATGGSGPPWVDTTTPGSNEVSYNLGLSSGSVTASATPSDPEWWGAFGVFAVPAPSNNTLYFGSD